MPIELTAHTDAGAALVAAAGRLSEQLAARAAEHDRNVQEFNQWCSENKDKC